jgi:esterase
MPDIQLPGIRLYYEERGSGTPILLINGTTGFTEVWGAATEELARLGRTIAYDRRGCSRSERPAPYETTSVRQQSDDAAALLGGLNASPAVVIGRSYGGGVAVDLAMRYPQHVKTLVLLEPALIGLSEETTRYFADLFRDVLGDAERNGTMYASESLLRTVAGDAGWEGLPEALRTKLAQNSPAVVAELTGGLLDLKPGDLGSVQQPVLIVSGANSPAGFRELNQVLLRELPNAREATVAGGHLITPADPQVLAFVEDVVGKS